jgi:hypothetical protein
VQEIGRQALALVVDAEEKPHPARDVFCPSCGKVISYVRRRPARLRTLFGSMEFKRAYYLCSACQQGCYPLDERLQLRPNAIIPNWSD